MEAEDAGFEVRDSITVVGPQRHQVWLFRKPVEAQNVVQQVLATGTGALNIDGCRVYGVAQKPGSMRAYRRFDDKGDKPELKEAPEPHPGGRWPPNLVLVHQEGCLQEGTRKVKGIPDPRRKDKTLNSGGMYGAGIQAKAEVANFNDPDGFETISSWICKPGCPIVKLDEQSGETTSGAMRHEVPGYTGESSVPFLRGRSGPSNQHGDSGGASRFFPQFRDEAELDVWLLRLILGSDGRD
jgi:hypothetical protein